MSYIVQSFLFILIFAWIHPAFSQKCNRTFLSSERIKLKSNHLGKIAEAAEKGDAEAQYKMGMLFKGHYGGILFYPDFKKSIDFFTRAAEQGHAESQYHLSQFILNRTSEREGYVQGLSWLKKASDQGHRDASYELALIYLKGDVTQPNLSKSLEILKRLAQQGHPQAQYKLGKLYLMGEEGMTVNFKEAFKLIKQAAEAPISIKEAKYDLSIMYRDGVGIKKNIIAANDWLNKFRIDPR